MNAVQAGTFRVVPVEPLSLYPDEFLERVRRDAEVDGVELVVVDSLRSYVLSAEAFGAVQAHLRNLLAYLCRVGVTAFLIVETESVTGDLAFSGLGISHMADNILLLRYAEYRGRVIKMVGCLKQRTGDFQAEMREFRLTAQGIWVGEKLSDMRGVLTGEPRYPET